MASPGVGIHIGETEHVSYQEVLGLVEQMATLVKQKTGRPVVIDSADWEQCRGRGPCVDAVRARTETTDVVIVRVLAGPLTLAIASERFYADVEATRTSSTSVPKHDQLAWRQKLGGMVARLFPELPVLEPPPPSGPLVVDLTPRPAEHGVAPWVVLGASGAVAGVGLGFGISNRIARARLEGEVTTMEERADLEARIRTHGIAAIALLGTATVGAVTAILLYAFD